MCALSDLIVQCIGTRICSAHVWQPEEEELVQHSQVCQKTLLQLSRVLQQHVQALECQIIVIYTCTGELMRSSETHSCMVQAGQSNIRQGIDA